jgi:hypothetical protein
MNKTNQPNPIIFHFSNAIGKIVNEYLTETTPNYEKLHLAILLTVNNYQKKLLFKEYRNTNPQSYPIGTHKICSEAIFYHTEVLGRKLALANNLEHHPTNLHNLLIAYCQLVQDQRWHHSIIQRGFHTREKIGDFFTTLAVKLTRQCKKLGRDYGSVAKNRRLEFGAYWFKVQEYAVEVAEELTLFEVIENIPTPLNNTEKPPLLLLKVIESLNKRYALLRSCGLPPERWLKADISIKELEELKQLHKIAESLIKQGESKVTAYRHAFEQLRVKQGKVAGFTEFGAFSASSLCERIFSNPSLSLDDKENEVNTLADNNAEDVEAQHKGLLALVKNYPEEFNEITQEVYLRTVVQGMTFAELVEDKFFLATLEQHPEYKKLSVKNLRATLKQQLGNILAQHSGG